MNGFCASNPVSAKRGVNGYAFWCGFIIGAALAFFYAMQPPIKVKYHSYTVIQYGQRLDLLV